MPRSVRGRRCCWARGATGETSFLVDECDSVEDLLGHDCLLVGCPTWNTGADTERSGTDWDEWYYEDDGLPGIDPWDSDFALVFFGFFLFLRCVPLHCNRYILTTVTVFTSRSSCAACSCSCGMFHSTVHHRYIP